MASNRHGCSTTSTVVLPTRRPNQALRLVDHRDRHNQSGTSDYLTGNEPGINHVAAGDYPLPTLNRGVTSDRSDDRYQQPVADIFSQRSGTSSYLTNGGPGGDYSLPTLDHGVTAMTSTRSDPLYQQPVVDGFSHLSGTSSYMTNGGPGVNHVASGDYTSTTPERSETAITFDGYGTLYQHPIIGNRGNHQQAGTSSYMANYHMTTGGSGINQIATGGDFSTSLVHDEICLAPNIPDTVYPVDDNGIRHSRPNSTFRLGSGDGHAASVGDYSTTPCHGEASMTSNRFGVNSASSSGGGNILQPRNGAVPDVVNNVHGQPSSIQFHESSPDVDEQLLLYRRNQRRHYDHIQQLQQVQMQHLEIRRRQFSPELASSFQQAHQFPTNFDYSPSFRGSPFEQDRMQPFNAAYNTSTMMSSTPTMNLRPATSQRGAAAAGPLFHRTSSPYGSTTPASFYTASASSSTANIWPQNGFADGGNTPMSGSSAYSNDGYYASTTAGTDAAFFGNRSDGGGGFTAAAFIAQLERSAAQLANYWNDVGGVRSMTSSAHPFMSPQPNNFSTNGMYPSSAQASNYHHHNQQQAFPAQLPGVAGGQQLPFLTPAPGVGHVAMQSGPGQLMHQQQQHDDERHLMAPVQQGGYGNSSASSGAGAGDAATDEVAKGARKKTTKKKKTENSGDESATQHIFQYGGNPTNASMSVGKTRTKDKYRSVYPDWQKNLLFAEFERDAYLLPERKERLAKETGLSERQVKIWFQNERAKKRRRPGSNEVTSSTDATVPLNGSSDQSSQLLNPNSSESSELDDSDWESDDSPDDESPEFSDCPRWEISDYNLPDSPSDPPPPGTSNNPENSDDANDYFRYQ